MFATMARQGGLVQLEQSDMHLALNMAKMGKGGFLGAAIEVTKYLVQKPDNKLQKEKKRGVRFPQHNKVKAAPERHSAMLHENHTDGCLPCQNCSAEKLQTRWRHKCTGAPPSDRLRQATLGLMRCPPRMPPGPPGDDEGAYAS